MIDVLWDIVDCIELVSFVLFGILLCVAIVDSIVESIKIFKENT